MTWSLRSRLKVALAAWALLFFLGVLPVAMLHNWKVGTMPVVEATLSNHHVIEVKRKNSADLLVRATVESRALWDVVGMMRSVSDRSMKNPLAPRSNSRSGPTPAEAISSYLRKLQVGYSLSVNEFTALMTRSFRR